MKDDLQKRWQQIYKKLRRTVRRFVKRTELFSIRFCRRNFGRLVMGLLILVLALGSVTGYGLGKNLAVKKAEKSRKKLAAEYGKEKAGLEEELRQAQIQNPEERPWYLTLVNDTHPMETGYVPELADIGGGHSVDKRIAEALKQMLSDGEKAGLDMMVCSAYRSVERQQELYNEYMGNAVREGKNYWQALEETGKSTAYPGRSEHNLGLAVDIVSSKYMKLDTKQEETAEAKWLAANCYKYGFILRYPVDKTEITGIIYEPWHYRYVGVEDAAKITEAGVTLEEYLGEN